MHMGLDISVLRIAQAGVLVYTRTLIEHLIIYGQQHQWTLLDVLPLNPDKPMVYPDVFGAPHVRIVRCTGLNRRYLSMCPVARTGMLHTVTSHIDHWLDAAWAVTAQAAVAWQLYATLRHVDLFHSSDQFLYAPGHAAAMLTINDLTTRVHPELHVAANTTMHSAKEHFAVTQADHIMTISHATKRDIVQHLHIPAERISVIYPAADDRFQPYAPDRTQPVLDRYGLQTGQYIVSIGTLEPRKNFVRLIEAYAHIRQACAQQHIDLPPLVIVGGNGWLYEEIHAAPARYGVAQHVYFLGKVPDADLPLLLAGAHLFVYPSLYEGFGLPVLEALACGVPVVAANSTSIPEVLGEAGIYCDPHDTSSIAQAMIEILLNPALAEQLRHIGPARAAQFSWERTARETLDVYAYVIGERKQRAR